MATFKGLLDEMAQAHIDNQVAQYILDGSFEKAVQRYIDNIEKKGGKLSKTSSGTTKKMRKQNYAENLQADKELADKITDEMWNKFDEAYKKQVEGEVDTERKTTKGKVRKTAEGKAEVKTSGQSQKIVKSNLEKKLVKTRMEYEALLKKTEDEDKKNEIQEHINGLNIMIKVLRQSATKAPLPSKVQDELKRRYDKIQQNVQKQISKQGGDEDEDDKYDEEAAKRAVDKIRAKLAGMKDYDDVEGLWREWLDRKKELEIEGQNESIERGLKQLLEMVKGE
jgi:hypothetical protein